MNHLTTILLSCILTVSALAFTPITNDALTLVEDANRLCDDVITLIEKSEGTTAYPLLEAYWQDPSKEFGTVSQKFEQFLEGAEQRCGKLLEGDLANMQKVDDYLVQFTYVLRYEQHPVWVRFTFFEGQEGFVLKDWSWGKNVGGIFE